MISDEKLNQMARLYAEQFDVGTREHAEDDYGTGFRAAESMSEARITELESAVRDMAETLGEYADYDESVAMYDSRGCNEARTTLEKHRALIEALKVTRA